MKLFCKHKHTLACWTVDKAFDTYETCISLICTKCHKIEILRFEGKLLNEDVAHICVKLGLI